jgi:hypothetical protein
VEVVEWRLPGWLLGEPLPGWLSRVAVLRSPGARERRVRGGDGHDARTWDDAVRSRASSCSRGLNVAENQPCRPVPGCPVTAHPVRLYQRTEEADVAPTEGGHLNGIGYPPPRPR